MPNFEVVDARIASALNKIIHNSQFKRRISLEEPKSRKRTVSFEVDRLPTRVIPGHWSQRFRRELCRLFTIVLRNNDIQEFDTKWDGILLSMTKIPLDDILEGLYKLRIRESEENPTWWHLGRIVQIRNTRVWETQDRIGIVRPGDSSEEVRTWLSLIENYGEEKYRPRDTK